MKLEELQPNATIRGILPDGLVTIVSVSWHGADALTLIYRTPAGKVAEEILYRHARGVRRRPAAPAAGDVHHHWGTQKQLVKSAIRSGFTPGV
jgi:hypothetical protein